MLDSFTIGNCKLNSEQLLSVVQLVVLSRVDDSLAINNSEVSSGRKSEVVITLDRLANSLTIVTNEEHP